jgi:hypothetical protein
MLQAFKMEKEGDKLAVIKTSSMESGLGQHKLDTQMELYLKSLILEYPKDIPWLIRVPLLVHQGYTI